MLARGGSSLCSFPLRKPYRLFGLLGSDRVRPWRFKAEFAAGFLGGAFGGCFNYRAQRIAHQTGVFAVGVVNAPELIAWTRSRSRAHGASSAQQGRAKMYQIHKMHAQSRSRPMGGHGKDAVQPDEHAGRHLRCRLSSFPLNELDSK
jgi:hypothetical protein